MYIDVMKQSVPWQNLHIYIRKLNGKKGLNDQKKPKGKLANEVSYMPKLFN